MIPKRIIQYWDKEEIPNSVQKSIKSWISKNPSYDHILYSKKDAIKYAFSVGRTDVGEALRRCTHPAMESDLFRIFALWESGGIYVDADHICFGKLEEIIDTSYQMILVRRRTGIIVNSFIASAPKNPHLQDSMRIILENIDKLRDKGNVYRISGAYAIKACLENAALEPTTVTLDWNYLRKKLQDVQRLEYKDSNPWNQTPKRKEMPDVNVIDDFKMEKPIIIAHAGGSYEGIRYSNSKEAVNASAKWASFVELDLCMGSDAVLVAHDGLESHYGFTEKFSNIREKEFLESKFKSRLTPWSLKELMKYTNKSNRKLILDIKGDNSQFKSILDEVIQLANKELKVDIIPQVYTQEDLTYAHSLGVESVIFAAWKNFHKMPISKEVFDLLLEFRNRFPGGLMLSIPFRSGPYKTIWIYHEEFKKFTEVTKVLVHGHDEVSNYELLANGFGVFSHYLK